MFDKNDSPGWAERATVHRSIVTHGDVERSRELAQEMNGHRSAAVTSPVPPEPTKAVSASLQTNGFVLDDTGRTEFRKHLHVLRERYKSWANVARALGKNPKSGGYLTDVANGKRTGGSRDLLHLARAIANGTTSPVELPAQPSRGSPSRAKHPRGYLKPAEKREVQERLQVMKKRHGTWASVTITLGADPKNKSYYGKLAQRGGGSKALLKTLRQLDTAWLPGDVANGDAEVEAVEVGAPEVEPKVEPKAKPSSLTPDPSTSPDMPWPVQAQQRLHEALSIVQHETERLPKALRSGMDELTTQITLCIEQLDIA